MILEEKQTGVFHSDCGYYIAAPVYADINKDYVIYWQLLSPYYHRLGNLLRWVNKNITNKEERDCLTLLINKKR